jgi:glycosyltransferase involved in cell wall biosynthesis
VPRVSVLVPTRNRPELARLCVATALLACGLDDEVVLADNSDAALELGELADDVRLRVLAPEAGRVLAMPDNWERVLAAARGEWVVLLSDKYMLVAGALDALLRRVQSAGLAVATYGYGVLHQELASHRERDEQALRAAGGVLRWPGNADAMQACSSAVALAALFAQVSYPRRHPMLYTALVHRDVIGAVRARGRYFVGSCPDVASACQILAASTHYLDTHLPAVMVQYPSASHAWSTGASTLAGGEVARRFFRELGAAGTHEPIERLVSGAIVETLLAFARARPDLAAHTRIAWDEFAKQASREIEALPWLRRPGLHLRLLAYTRRHGAPLTNAYPQARTALASHLPRGLLTPLLRWRRRLFHGVPGPDELLPVTSTTLATRAAALAHLAALVRDPQDAPGPA